MVIRHAEKPNGKSLGVSMLGRAGKDHLTPRGWQRAGALAALFSPPPGMNMRTGLSTPQFLFALTEGSQRSFQTILPLSHKINSPIIPGSKGKEAELVASATGLDGPVLVSWQRERIPDIAKYLLADSPDGNIYPRFWPQSCFDLIWVFDLNRSTGYYRFAQVPQLLLAGDSETVISSAATEESSRMLQKLG
jgi:hypothetical protein